MIVAAAPLTQPAVAVSSAKTSLFGPAGGGGLFAAAKSGVPSAAATIAPSTAPTLGVNPLLVSAATPKSTATVAGFSGSGLQPGATGIFAAKPAAVTTAATAPSSVLGTC